jgi:DNA ligase-1
MQLPTLYKKAKNGKISLWYVATYEEQIVIAHGYTDGQKQSETIECAGKNQGRVNATTSSEQAELEARSRWQKQKDKGYTEDPSGIAQMDVVLPMLAQKYSERAKHITFPCYVQPKLNGMRCISYMKNGQRVYQSRLGKIWTNLSHLDKELEAFGDLILDGEIYLHGLNLQDIGSLIKNSDKSNVVNGKMVTDLEYWIYDCITPETFERRTYRVSNVFDCCNEFDKVIEVETSRCLNATDLMSFHAINLDDGFEGTMLRNMNGLYSTNKRSNDLQKLKPVLDDEFEIVGGYMVETGREEGTCIFTCCTKTGVRFDVRPMGTLEQRKEYWQNLKSLIGKKLTCKFQEWTADGKPFHARGVAIRDYE